jgi:hypothetical protein
MELGGDLRNFIVVVAFHFVALLMWKEGFGGSKIFRVCEVDGKGAKCYKALNLELYIFKSKMNTGSYLIRSYNSDQSILSPRTVIQDHVPNPIKFG